MARVLVVDDDESVRQLIAFTLEDHGHQITQVGSGEEALSRLRAATFDLIVLDRTMPGLSGIQVLSALNILPVRKAMKVLMCTGAGLMSQVAEALDAGADDYIVKDPEGFQALPDKVARLAPPAKPAV